MLDDQEGAAWNQNCPINSYTEAFLAREKARCVMIKARDLSIEGYTLGSGWKEAFLGRHDCQWERAFNFRQIRLFTE